MSRRTAKHSERAMVKPGYPTCVVCFRKRSDAEKRVHHTLCSKCKKRLDNAPPESDGMNLDESDRWDEP